MITLDQGGRGAAGAIHHAVPPSLREQVEGVWTLHSDPGPGAERWRVIADPSPHVVLARQRDGRMRASVVGARSRWIDVDHAARAYVVGIRMAPGVLGALSRLPALELVDRGARLDELFGTQGRAVTRRLEDAPSAATAISILLAFLSRRLTGHVADWRVRGFMATLAADPGTSVKGAGRRLGVSPRSLRDAVRDGVGLGPKETQRIHRLQRALTVMRRGRGASRAAHGAGYADHAHLVHECRTLLGEPPTRFLRRGTGADSYKAEPAGER